MNHRVTYFSGFQGEATLMLGDQIKPILITFLTTLGCKLFSYKISCGRSKRRRRRSVASCPKWLSDWMIFFSHDCVKIGLSNTVTEFLSAGYTFEHEKPERGALRKPHFDFRATGPALIQTPNFHVPNPMHKLLQRTLQAVWLKWTFFSFWVWFGWIKIDV